MTVRAIKKSDLNFIAAEKENFADGWNSDMLLSAYKTGRFFGFIAKDCEKNSGFITYSVLAPDADIESVYVKKEIRRRGAADKLLDAAIKDIKEKGGKKIFLEVRENNIPAINLYIKHGFKEISVRKKYYGEENALVFCKEI